MAGVERDDLERGHALLGAAPMGHERRFAPSRDEQRGHAIFREPFAERRAEDRMTERPRNTARIVQAIVGDERFARDGGKPPAAAWIHRQRLESASAVLLECASDGFDRRRDSLSPRGVRERRHRVGEHLNDHALGVVERVSNRQRRAERIAAEKPMVDPECPPQALELADIAGGRIGEWVFRIPAWRGRS
jgi:hypothetical protein